jgi:hypothetical protein
MSINERVDILAPLPLENWRQLAETINGISPELAK